MNWLNTRARWPLPTTAQQVSISVSSLLLRQVVMAGSSSGGEPACRLSCRSSVSERRIVNRLASRSSMQAEHLLPLALQMESGTASGASGCSSTSSTCSCFGRQVGRDLLLRPALDQRLDPAPQLIQQLAVTLRVLDRPGVVLPELLRMREQSRCGDRQQRPQLHQVVLHRRAGDRQLERRRQPARALIDLGLVILSVLGLVQDQARTTPAARSWGSRAAAACTWSPPRPRRRLTSGESLRRLARVSVITTTFRPGANRAASAAQFDTTLVGATIRNGGPARVGLPGVADQRQRLQRLAKAHVVGEDAAELVLPQERQPLEAVELIRAQLRGQRRRRRGGRGRCRSASKRLAPAVASACACWLTTPSSASSAHRPPGTC